MKENKEYPFKSPFNSEPEKGEVATKPSQTMRGQTLTIAQMLTRINNGMPVNLNRSLQYGEDDEPLPKIRDLTDLDDISNQTQYVINKAKKEALQRELDAQNYVPKKTNAEPYIAP